MELTSSPATAGSAANPALTANAQSDSAALSSDFETFLQLLTAQLENQDPLNPMDSQDFATQLATFSGVEQQVKTNELLTALQSQATLTGLADLAGWIGRDARLSGPVPFAGDPLTVVPDIPPAADQATLIVRNDQGAVVQRTPLSLSTREITWDGRDTNGLSFPSGRYSFEVEATAQGAELDTRPAQAYAEIAEVRLEGSAQVVVLRDGSTRPVNLVTGLR